MMRQSEMLVPTLREAPAEADAAGHRWLLRSGMIRQLAAGIYSYLPLGRRILLNVERIVREEMDRAGCQEVLLPIMQPAGVVGRIRKIHTVWSRIDASEGSSCTGICSWTNT